MILVDRLIEASNEVTKSDPQCYYLGLKIASSKLSGAPLERLIDEYGSRNDPDLAQLALSKVTDSDKQVFFCKILLNHGEKKFIELALRNSLCQEAKELLASYSDE
jgi:hypothetical protein